MLGRAVCRSPPPIVPDTSTQQAEGRQRPLRTCKINLYTAVDLRGRPAVSLQLPLVRSLPSPVPARAPPCPAPSRTLR